jgi:hypothetical protein
MVVGISLARSAALQSRSAAHTDADVEQTVEAARGAAIAYRKAPETGRPGDLVTGRPVAPAHRRFAAPRDLGPRREVSTRG